MNEASFSKEGKRSTCPRTNASLQKDPHEGQVKPMLHTQHKGFNEEELVNLHEKLPIPPIHCV
jgi:hypothetical protein